MERKYSEKGAVMVEAAIYMPLVLCTVMAMIYLALFNMQEYMMMYEAQRVAAVAAREEAYIGYEYFGMGTTDHEIDFDWGEGNYPSAENVTAYYIEHSNKISNMYRELGELFEILFESANEKDTRATYKEKLKNYVQDASLLALDNIINCNPEVEIDKSLLGTKVTATITQSLPMPGVIQYLGLSEQFSLRTAAYTYSVNPADFVRNVDLAVDLTSYVLEKLGVADNVNAFFDKTKEVLGKIL